MFHRIKNNKKNKGNDENTKPDPEQWLCAHHGKLYTEYILKDISRNLKNTFLRRN